MKFTKMQGCGNDYVYINCFPTKNLNGDDLPSSCLTDGVPEAGKGGKETCDHYVISNPSDLAIKISDRHFGVGADGLILIEPSEHADAFMHMFNLDGSEGSMCGNGIRCVAKYIYDHGIIPKERDTAFIETKAGIREIRLFKENGRVARASVAMGEARLDGNLKETIEICGMDLCFVPINVGNPHAIYFLEDNPALKVKKVSQLDLLKYGQYFENHPRFPDKVNSEFVDIVSPSEINFRVWERGSGETLACGTGATAAVAAGIYLGKLENEVLVHLAGGDLFIKTDVARKFFHMEGPAVEVFEGDYPYGDS